MAPKNTAETTEEWSTVAEESPTRVVFDTVGDVLIGEYLYRETVEQDDGDNFDVLVFRGTDGELYSTSPGYKLEKAFEKVTPGQMVRITFIKEVPIKGQVSPMKDFRVDVRA